MIELDWRDPRTSLEELLIGDRLTARELEVLQGAANGETAGETGQRIFLAMETVKSYRKRVIAKLGARNIAGAVAIAMRQGLIQ